MAAEVEIIGVSTKSAFATPLPTSNPVIGSTADANTAKTMQGWLKGNRYVKVAAAQTTAQISVSGDGVPGRDYLERVLITHATTATGTVTLFDGTTSLFIHTIGAYGTVATAAPLCFNYELNVLAESTKGFNITTGSSVTCVAIGRFSTS